MKRFLAMLILAAVLLSAAALSENGQGNPSMGGQPPEKPEGEMPSMGGQPPEKPEGEMPSMGGQPPEKPEGEMPSMDGQPPEKPEGEMPSMGRQPPMGGGQGAPDHYDAVHAFDADGRLTGAVESTATDESAVLVTAGTVKIEDAAIVRTSQDSTGGDASSFYGTGAAVLVTGGEIEVCDSQIESDACGGAGVFAYGDGVARVSDTSIETRQGTSGGIHVAGGGTLYAQNLNVLTMGESSAAIRSDRGGGTMVVNGGSYTSTGSGSPAVYVTADISINGAELAALGSEALCLEGRNCVRLTDCVLRGNMPDLEVNDNTWTVILYQSMSGDAEVGEGSFEMNGGKLVSENGGLFYTTNTQSRIRLSNVEIEAPQDCAYFLRCTGNQNARGWGRAGANGAACVLTAVAQEMKGDVIWDSVSELTLYAAGGSVLTGAVVQDESCAGAGGAGQCALYIDADSAWIVTGDSTLSALCCAGRIADAEGKSVSILGTDGTVFAAGESEYVVTVSSYSEECDLSGAQL